VENFKLDSLRIDATDNGMHLSLRWLGKSRDRQPVKVLGPFLSSAIDDAKGRGGKVAMHFEDLEYLNSGTVMAIVQTIHRAKKVGVPLEISYSDALEWQRLSFDPMKVLALPGTVDIVAVSRSEEGA
jgi:hypothetical protein